MTNALSSGYLQGILSLLQAFAQGNGRCCYGSKDEHYPWLAHRRLCGCVRIAWSEEAILAIGDTIRVATCERGIGLAWQLVAKWLLHR